MTNSQNNNYFYSLLPIWNAMKGVENLISTRDRANLYYVCGGNHHLTNWFCKDELDLNS